MNRIPVDQITVGVRVRQAIPEDVAVIAESFKTEGQLQAIIVRRLGPKAFRLVAGLHRLEAAKLLGWSDIGAEEFPLTGDAELDDINEGIAECDENMKRVELDLAMRPLFVVRRVGLTDQRNALGKARSANKAEEKARTRRDTAKSGPEKAEAQKAWDAARKAKDRAELEVQRTRRGPTGPDDVQDKLRSDTLRDVSVEVGLNTVTVRHDVARVRHFGHEVLTLANRINLGSGKASTRDELEALRKVQTAFPEDYERIVASWRAVVNGTKKAVPFRPSVVLRDCQARLAAANKANKGILADLEALRDRGAKLREDMIAYRQAASALKGINWKNTITDLRTAEARVGSSLDLVKAIVSAEKLLQTGIR